jgi:hypothetical protein
MNFKNTKWFLLQEWVAGQLKEIDPYARSTKQSGAGSESGDVKNNFLNVECKCYNQKSPYKEEWLEKCQSEIPLHSQKLAIVVTENNEGKRRVHFDAEDFFRIFKRSL